jgi:hypothetical protein
MRRFSVRITIGMAYAKSPKFAGSRPEVMNEFHLLPAALDPGVYSASDRKEYQNQ